MDGAAVDFSLVASVVAEGEAVGLKSLAEVSCSPTPRRRDGLTAQAQLLRARRHA